VDGVPPGATGDGTGPILFLIALLLGGFVSVVSMRWVARRLT